MKKLIFAFCLALGLVACGGGGGSSTDASSAGLSADALKAKAVVPDPTLAAQAVSMVNTTLAGNQVFRTIGALADGGYTVGWTSGTASFIQRYDNAGAKIGGETLIPQEGSMAVLTGGDVVVACCSQSIGVPARVALTASRFSADGVLLSEAEVVVYDQTIFDPRRNLSFFRNVNVLPLADGGFVVGWVGIGFSSIGVSNTLFTRRYDSQGQPLGDAVVVSRFDLGDADSLSYSFAADGEGGYSVTVVTPVLVQRDPFVFVPSTSVIHFDANQTATQIVAPTFATVLLLPLEGDRFVLFTSDASGTFSQFLDASGAPVGDAIPIPTIPTDARELADGSFVVFWNASGILMFQRFDSAGAVMGNVQTIATHVGATGVAALAGGGFALAWSGPSGNGDLDVFTTRFVEVLSPDKAALRAKRKACLNSAKGMTGQERKSFVDACLAA